MARRVRLLGPSLILLAVALLPATVRAQELPPPYVAVLDGQATLIHGGQSDGVFVNAPLVAGDQIETSSGRVDILFADGTTLDLDESSRLDIESPLLFRLMAGQILLTVGGVPGAGQAVRYQVDTPQASIATAGPGAYRVSAMQYADGPLTQLAVLRGTASLATDRGSVRVDAGRLSLAGDRDQPSMPQPFNTARVDAFDRWTASIRDGRVATASARQYLPPDLQIYGSVLDRNGDWRYLSPYGYVWYPRVVATWRPYYFGRWAPYAGYGWTWIGTTVWSWPTHHYGRWGVSAGSWFWIPDAHWGPGWVSWASAQGYVGWSPLGFDGQPVFPLIANLTLVQPSTSWVFVASDHFGRTWYADRFAVAPRSLPRGARFVARGDAPVRLPSRPEAPSRVGVRPVLPGGGPSRGVRAIERGPVGRPPSGPSPSFRPPRQGEPPIAPRPGSQTAQPRFEVGGSRDRRGGANESREPGIGSQPPPRAQPRARSERAGSRAAPRDDANPPPPREQRAAPKRGDERGKQKAHPRPQ
jgi:Family of unknown function (DUF6600)/FecR protein